MSGLVTDHDYVFQIVTVDDRPAAGGRLMRLGTGLDFEAGAAIDSIDYTQDVPQLITGTFRAVGRTQTISAGLHGAISGYGNVNAFQLRRLIRGSLVLIQ